MVFTMLFTHVKNMFISCAVTEQLADQHLCIPFMDSYGFQNIKDKFFRYIAPILAEHQILGQNKLCQFSFGIKIPQRY